MILTSNPNQQEGTLMGKIQQVVNKKFSREFEKENEQVKQIFARAQITPIGQILHRSTITAGGNVGKQVARPEGQQRAANLIDKLGVKYIGGLSSNFSYPRIDGNTSEWVSETESGNANNATFEGVSLTPRRLLSYVEYSNEVVLNPNTDVAGAIEEDLIGSIWETVQATMLNDIYTDATPTTLADYNDIVAFELAASNQKISNGVYVVSPTAASKLKLMLNGSMPIYFNGQINGYRVIETPSLDAESIIFADWSKLLLGQWGALDITCDNVTKAPQGIVKLIINSFWDWGKIDPNAFAFATTASGNA